MPKIQLILITLVVVVLGLMVACSSNFDKGVEYRDQGKYDEAVHMFDKAIQNNPKDPDAYFNRAIAYDLLEDYEKSAENYSKAIQLDPNDPDADV